MPLSDKRRPSVSLDVVHDISVAFAGQQTSCQPALRFWQDKITHVLEKKGEYDFSQNFACCREKGDATTFATFCSVTNLHLFKNNVCIFPLLFETFGGPAVKDKIMQPSV